jgi:PAS domain S-box-containing protein
MGEGPGHDGAEHWRRCVEDAPVAIAMLDSHMRYLAVSRRWRTDYALGGLELEGRCHDDLFPDTPDGWKVILEQCLDGAAEREHEDAHLRADGSRRAVRWAVRPWRVATGEVGGVIVYSEDVTERVRSAERLAETNQRLRMALEAASATAWSMDARTGVFRSDVPGGPREGVEEPPLSLEQVLGRIHPDDRARVAAKIADARRVRGPNRWEYEYRRLESDGRVSWRQSVARVQRDEAGQAICISGVSLDMTAKKASEEELSRSHAELEERTAELERRMTQLRKLASSLTLAEQHAREQLAKTLHDHLQQLLFSASLKLDRLTARMAGSDLDAGLAAGARGDIEDAIAAARSLSVELFPPALHERGLPSALEWLAGWMRQKYGLTVRLSLDPRGNPDRKDVRILLFESVRELLFNVIKHARTTEAAVDLALGPEQTLVITVTDEGAGFDPAVVFAQTNLQQAGLGLFSIRERLTLLGGRLDVTSAPGRGATFGLIAPRASAIERRADVRALVDLAGGLSSDGVQDTIREPLRILIADDHALVRKGLRELMGERPELEVVGEAADGFEAIAQAHALRPDVIVMDVSMPGLDGVEATRRIRAELPFIDVFGLSTYERTGELHAIEQAGATGYFAKGDDTRQLIGRLLTVRARHLNRGD